MPKTDQQVPRENILGVSVSAINLRLAVRIIDAWIKKHESHYVCVTPAHGIMDCVRRPELRLIFNASGLTAPDGMSIVWLLRTRGYREVGRVYGPDLMLAVCEHSIKYGYRHFFYGGAPGVTEKLTTRLRSRFPHLQVVGTYAPPFRQLTQVEDEELIRRINDTQPDIIWVGISTPKQEQWMHVHLGKVCASVLIGVGAAFDFLSGNKRQAPRWIQRSGLEWLYRLVNEPRRLWRRYIQYPLFGLLVILQALGLKRYPLD